MRDFKGLKFLPSLPLALIYLSAFFSFWLAFPGVIYTDTIIQFKDVLSGSFGDWQMPIMIGWWSVLHKLFPVAPLNFFLFQTFVFLAAFTLLFTHFKDKPSRWILAALAWTPPVLAANLALWKDTQMASSYLLSFALCLSALKAKKKVGKAVLWIMFGLTLFYGTGIRHNAAAALPFLFLGVWLWRGRKLSPKVVAASFALTFLIFGLVRYVSDAITDRDYYPAQIIKVYDLVGIRHYGGEVEWPAYFDPRAELKYSPATVNDLFFKGPKPAVGMVFDRQRVNELHVLWIKGVLNNPLAYLKHKLGVYAVFTRLNEPDRDYYDVQTTNVRNPFGWRQPMTRLRMLFYKILKPFEGGVFFMPWIWLLLALGLLAWQARSWSLGAYAKAATMLNLSGLAYFAGMFPILPSAMEFRYFYWTYVAAFVSAAIFMGGRFPAKDRPEN